MQILASVGFSSSFHKLLMSFLLRSGSISVRLRLKPNKNPSPNPTQSSWDMHKRWKSSCHVAPALNQANGKVVFVQGVLMEV